MTDTPPLDTDWHGNALDMHIEESRSTFSMRRFGPYINIGVVGGQVAILNAEQAAEIAKSLWAAAHLARETTSTTPPEAALLLPNALESEITDA